uniref:polymeric immunoglobulin receptor-like isoform X2 n=1 Tax=Oncorhynchus gorbuscha TaxID=8017 RepID=UPI001EAEEC23|nr:polymeric immunoglobulin receptor-like isoform X2 [Oncorhynchus gorbuscha]XP_046146458.1 polymeric immunoglobulin receptor-like isoform X2 [Oncorhynchus gorbuscha]
MVSHLSLSIVFLIFSRLSGAYRVSVKTGGSITIPCPYDLRYKTHVKYLCKLGYLHRCSPDVHSKSINKASISHYINKQTFTVTMTDLRTEDSGRYSCAVEIDVGPDVIIKTFQLSVTPGTPELYVDQQEVTGVEGGSVIVNCYYSNTGNRKGWCRIGGSGSCVGVDSGTIKGTSVTLQQTTDATRRNVLMVTKGGLKMENTGWYRCGVGDLIMPVHITVRQQTTTQSTTTMTTTQAPTTEQSSFSPTAEPVQTDNTVQGPEGSKEKVAMSSIDLNVLLIPLGMLVVVISGVLVTWKMWRKYKDNKALDQTTNTSVDPFPANDVMYSTVVPKRRNQLNVQTKGQPYDVVYSSLVLHPTEGRNTAVTD